MSAAPAVPMALSGIIFFIFWLFMMIGALIGYIILLIAVWRAMKAHESIAESVKAIAEKQ